MNEDLAGGPFFVGRERGLDWLRDRTRGPGHAIIVAGPRGSGKTTLLSKFLYDVERRPFVRWQVNPDPASFEALRGEIETLYERSDRTEIVVIDNAECLGPKSALYVRDRVLNLKRIRAVIFVTTRRLDLPNAYTLSLGSIGGTIYELKDGLLVPERKLILDIAPKIVLANESLAMRLKECPHSVDELSPRQFELLIADLLDDMGYDVTVTQATRDGGKDILASLKTPLGRILCLVEAKRYRRDRAVGVGLVRQLYGTLEDAEANSAMLVTTSKFSRDARAFQSKHEYRLDLRDYEHVVQWISNYGRN